MALRYIAHAAALIAALSLSACGGGGGGGSSPAPTVSINASAASVLANGMVTLTWSSSNAASCTASGGWTGTQAVSGSQTVTVVQTVTYTLSCTGSGGSASSSAAVTAYAQPAPVISVDHASVLNGTPVTVTWSSTDATACTASGGDLTSTALSGTYTSPALGAPVTYTLSCTNPVVTTPVVASAAVAVTNSVSLTVNVAAQVPGDPVVDSARRHYVPDWGASVNIPVPFVYVALVDANQNVLQSTFADANGSATFTPLDPTKTYSVVAQSKIRTTTVPALDFEVVNNTGTAATAQGSFRSRYGVYSVSSAFTPSASGAATQTVNIIAPDGWDAASSSLIAGNRVAAPFVILAYAVKEAQIVSAATGLSNPTWRPLTVLWSVTNKGGLTAPPNNFDQGSVTGSGGFWSSGHKTIAADGTDSGATSIAEDYIYLSGDPGFEIMDIYPFVMSHEMGHFVQSLFSTRVSMAGSHAYTDYEDFELSWVEGSASGIAALVLNTPQQRRITTVSAEIVVSVVDISNNTVNGTPVAGTSSPWPVGWYQESTVSDLIWTAHSSMGLSNAQTLSPMFSSAWKTGPYINSIWSYATLLKKQMSSIAGAVDTFSSTHNFVTAGSDEYGLGETHAGNRASKDVLPPYTNLGIGQTITLCTAGALLEFNQAGNNRYFKLTGDGTSRTLTIQGAANTVPIVGHNPASNTSKTSTFTGTATAPAAGAVYSVGECGVAGGEFATDTAACGDPNPPAEQCWTIGYQ